MVLWSLSVELYIVKGESSRGERTTLELGEDDVQLGLGRFQLVRINSFKHFLGKKIDYLPGINYFYR